MKKKISILIIFLAAVLIVSCNKSEAPTASTQQESHEDNRMTNNCIDGTNAKEIVHNLIDKYQLTENNSGTESQINHSILYSGENDVSEDALSYDITSNNNGEIEFATFTTSSGNLDYLEFCATLLETDLISPAELKQWILESSEDSDTQIGDCNFSLIFNSDNVEGSITLYADGDIE